MFERLPWQQELWQRILEQQQEGRLPHALLFSGPQGIGKRQFAAYLAAALLCKNLSEAGHCGHCRSCDLLKAGSHPDLIHLNPEEAGKVIKVDQVRRVIDQLHATAQQGGYRLLVVYPAEELNISAANALLKTLEEPGEATLIILVVDQLGQVMPTIRSRCQRLDFPLPARDESVAWLIRETGVDQTSAEGLLTISQGAPLRAKQWKDSGSLELRAKFLSGLADIVRGRDTPLQIASALQKEDVGLILNWWISLVNDIVHMQVAGAEAPRVNSDMLKMISALAKRVKTSALFELTDQLIVERKGLLKHQNPNKQLMLEKLLLGWKALLVTE